MQVIVHPPPLAHLIGDLDEPRADVDADDLAKPAGRRRELERAPADGASKVERTGQRETRTPGPGGQQLSGMAWRLEGCLD